MSYRVFVVLRTSSGSGGTAGGEGERLSTEVAVLAALDHQQGVAWSACHEQAASAGPGAKRR